MDTSRRSPPWSHGPDRSDSRDGDPRFTAEIAETAEMGPEPGGRVGRVRGTGARFAFGRLLGVFLSGLCGLCGESVPSHSAVRRVVQKVVIAEECLRRDFSGNTTGTPFVRTWLGWGPRPANRARPCDPRVESG